MKYETIKPYIEKKLISEQVHPENPDVRIFNYTQHCQFEGAWDEVTKQCRGLILNVETGEILARPFPKFFNYAEHVAKGWEIPKSKPVVTEKLDGSLGILYWLDGKPYIATRGSFASDQAQWATKYFQTYWERTGLKDYGFTHLFEIIYPENRIVVNYDFSDLVYLGSINRETGSGIFIDYPFRKVKYFDIDDVQNLLKLDEPNSEGFVLFYPEENVRMKIKFPEYVRLHKILTGLSVLGIWQSLSEGEEISFEKVPDEFFKWYSENKDELLAQYNRIEKAAQELHRSLEGLENRKDKADHIFKNGKRFSSIVFNILDGRDYKKAIWRMVRPKGNKLFKTDIDETSI